MILTKSSNASSSPSSSIGSHGSWTSIHLGINECYQVINYGKTISDTHRSSSSGSGTGLSRRNKCFCRIFLTVYNGVYLFNPFRSQASLNIPPMFRLHQVAPISAPTATPGGVGIVPIKANSTASLSTKTHQSHRRHMAGENYATTH
jgi:hypothetical protein